MKYKPGDLLLVKYKKDFIGFLVRWFTKSKWNHVAWILDKDTIVEARNGGIRLSQLSRYHNTSLYETKVIRLKNYPVKKLELLAMIEKIWVNYTWFNAPRYKLPIFFTFLAVAFNRKVNRDTCSGYIARTLSYSGYKFRDDKSYEYITPADIDNSNMTEEVCQCPEELFAVVQDNVTGNRYYYCAKCGIKKKLDAQHVK